MKITTCNSSSLNVFDFNEEDELPEPSSSNLLEKINSFSAEDQAMLKYKFLQCVTQHGNDHTDDMGITPCVDVDVDVDVIVINQCCDNADLHTAGEECGSKEGKIGSVFFQQCDSVSDEHRLHFTRIDHESGALVPKVETKTSSYKESTISNGELNCGVSESPLDDGRVGRSLYGNESMSESSPTSASNLVDDDGVHSLACCFDGCEMDDTNMAVNLSPDFMVCEDTCCTDALISFSSSCIQIRGSLSNGNQGDFNHQWEIDDIVNLECHWYGRAVTALLKLHVISKDAVEATDSLGPSGIQEWIIAVVDSNWPSEQQKITSLNVKYKAIWNIVIDGTAEMEEALLEQNTILSTKHFFPNFDQPFEEVIYPKGDSDPVSISKRDVDLLQPESFLNDTIVDFYIKYLKNKIHPEDRHRFHFFNSFFFRKLADLEKDPFSASEGRTAFLRVRKWTRKVNLFEKDYVFIPINFNLHWSLIVICHPGEVSNFKNEDVEKALKVPCILHMDSIKGNHAGLKNHIQSYLWEEWKEKQNEVSEHISLNFRNMRFIPLELPQQENSFDCGLFLLHYVELFLEEAPVCFSPFKITKFSSFLNVDWFPPTEASLKRAPILRLIYDILVHETSPNDCNEEHQCIEHKNNGADLEFISDSYKSSKHCHEDLVSCQTSQGIEMTLLEASSIRNSQYLNDKGLVVGELFNPDNTAILDSQFQSFNQTTTLYQYKNHLPPIEEDLETGEQFMYSPSGITVSRGFGAQTSYLLSMQAEQQCDNSSSETSICASDDDDDAFDAAIIERNSYEEHDELSHSDNSDQRSPSTESPTSASSELPKTNLENEFHRLDQESDIEENRKIQYKDDLLLERDDQQFVKRRRITPTIEERRLTKSM